MSFQAARTDLRLMLKKAGIEKKISLHKLRHAYATKLINAGAELVDIKALLGHESIATTQIYTNVGYDNDSFILRPQGCISDARSEKRRFW